MACACGEAGCKDRRSACSSLSLLSSSAMQCACANGTAPVGTLARPMPGSGVTRALTYRCVGSSCRMMNDSFLWSRCCSRSTCRMYCRVGMSHDSSTASSTAVQLMTATAVHAVACGRRAWGERRRQEGPVTKEIAKRLTSSAQCCAVTTFTPHTQPILARSTPSSVPTTASRHWRGTISM